MNPDLVVRDDNGEIYTVRYEAVNAMLLNEFLKEHRKVQELEMNTAQQQKQIDDFAAVVHRLYHVLGSIYVIDATGNT